jgi:hypothetical protein
LGYLLGTVPIEQIEISRAGQEEWGRPWSGILFLHPDTRLRRVEHKEMDPPLDSDGIPEDDVPMEIRSALGPCPLPKSKKKKPKVAVTTEDDGRGVPEGMVRYDNRSDDTVVGSLSCNIVRLHPWGCITLPKPVAPLTWRVEDET